MDLKGGSDFVNWVETTQLKEYNYSIGWMENMLQFLLVEIIKSLTQPPFKHIYMPASDVIIHSHGHTQRFIYLNARCQTESYIL